MRAFVGLLAGQSIFGAGPSVVPRDVAGGPRNRFRLLAVEEDLARERPRSLSAAQRRVALFDTCPYGDIVTLNPRAVRTTATSVLRGAAFHLATMKAPSVSEARPVAAGRLLR